MMFYDIRDIDSIVRCAFCGAKFEDGAKLIPQCGNSICGDCYQDLKNGADNNAEFKCKACGTLHMFPKDGLVDDHSVIKLLKIKPREMQFPDQTEMLKLTNADIQDSILKLQSFNGIHEINSYFDQQELSVTLAAESAIKNLRDEQDECTKQINSYRSELISSYDVAKLDEEMRELGAIASSYKEWQGNLKETVHDPTEEYRTACTFMSGIKKKEETMRERAFDNCFMRFEENAALYTSSLGVFQKDTKPHAVTDEWNAELIIESAEKCSINSLLFISSESLAFCTQEGYGKIIDILENKIVKTLQGHVKEFRTDPIYSLNLLPDGKLAGASGKHIQIWDLNQSTKHQLSSGSQNEAISSLVTFKNGNLASCSFDGTIGIWDPFANRSKPSFLFSFPSDPVAEWSVQLGGLSNNNLVTATSKLNTKSTIKVWSPADGKLVKAVQTNADNPQALLVLPDDKIAISSTDGSVQIINLEDNTTFRQFNDLCKMKILSLAWHPDGFLFGGGSICDPTIKIWDIETGRLVKTIQTSCKGHIYALSISSDGKKLACGSDDGKINVWSLQHHSRHPYEL